VFWVLLAFAAAGLTGRARKTKLGKGAELREFLVAPTAFGHNWAKSPGSPATTAQNCWRSVLDEEVTDIGHFSDSKYTIFQRGDFKYTNLLYIIHI
jgi:hypothetical protein